MSGQLENMQPGLERDHAARDLETPAEEARAADLTGASIKLEDEGLPPSDGADTVQNGDSGEVCVKEEPRFYTEGDVSTGLNPPLCSVKEEPTDMEHESYTPVSVNPQCPPLQVKEEPPTHEEGGLQHTDPQIKQELQDEEMSEPHPDAAVKEEVPSSEEDDSAPPSGNVTGDEADPASSKAAHTCPVCNRIFESHGNLSRHRETHKGVKMTCSVCGANFCNKTDLAAHAKEHRAKESPGSSKTPHDCPVCKRTFNTHADLTRHRETHKGKTMSCKECGANFCNKTDLATHARTHRASGTSPRPSNATHSCPVCKRTFNTPGNLIKHSESQKGMRVSCLQCGANFCNKTDLAAHARKHRVGKVFICFECDETFPTMSHLTVHKSIHAGEKLFPCNHCGKQFAEEANLREHMKAHVDIQEFCCTICGKSFSGEEDLLDHHQEMHEDEGTIICSECGLTFVDQDTLDRHLRFHKLHKPFSCGLCGKQFVHKTELTRHERTHVN